MICQCITAEPECETVWLTRPDMRAYGGLPVYTANTTQECYDICEAEPDCVAVDLDRTTGSMSLCWIHLDPQNLANVFHASMVHHSRLLRQCPSKGILVLSCLDGTILLHGFLCISPTFHCLLACFGCLSLIPFAWDLVEIVGVGWGTHIVTWIWHSSLRNSQTFKVHDSLRNSCILVLKVTMAEGIPLM